MFLNQTLVAGRITADPELRWIRRKSDGVSVPACSANIYTFTPLPPKWRGRIRERKLYLRIDATGVVAEKLHAKCQENDWIICDGQLESYTTQYTPHDAHMKRWHIKLRLVRFYKIARLEADGTRRIKGYYLVPEDVMERYKAMQEEFDEYWLPKSTRDTMTPAQVDGPLFEDDEV